MDLRVRMLMSRSKQALEGWSLHRRRAAGDDSTRLDGEAGGLHLANLVLGGLTNCGDTGV